MRLLIRSATAAALWLIVGPAGGAAQTQAFQFDTALARRYFREAADLTARDAGVLWGRSLAGPILFVEPRSRTLLASEPDRDGLLKASEGFQTGTLPTAESPANTAFRFGGRSWAMIVWPLPADSVARTTLLAHELWHRIQDSLGLSSSDRPNPHLAASDGRLWLRLEGRALRRAIQEVGAVRSRALKDALLFRRARRQRFPGADSTERLLEMNEGLAEYTGVVLAASDTGSRRALVVARLAALDTMTNYERSFAYQTGPAYGFLLDEVAPGWRSGLARETGLSQRLGLALGETSGQAKTAVTRGAGYGYAAVRKQEVAREKSRFVRASTLRTRFVTGALLELPLAEMKLGFDPGKVEALDSVGTIYGGLRLSDRWGVLQSDASGGLISGDWTRLVVPAPLDTTGRRLTGPGWVLELANGWRLVPGRRPGDWTVEREP